MPASSESRSEPYFCWTLAHTGADRPRHARCVPLRRKFKLAAWQRTANRRNWNHRSLHLILSTTGFASALTKSMSAMVVRTARTWITGCRPKPRSARKQQVPAWQPLRQPRRERALAALAALVSGELLGRAVLTCESRAQTQPDTGGPHSST